MKENLTKEDKNSFAYAWRQQIFKAWQPVPTINSTICLFVCLGVFFLSLGIIMLKMSDNIIEIQLRYDNLSACNTIPGTCQATLTISQDINEKVYVYYALENFYQNHRRYIKSRDNDQLAGVIKSAGDLSNCDPIIYNRDLDFNVSFGNITLSPNEPANPCGLIAKSIFNDSYILLYPNGTTVTISETNIAWPSDKEKKFKAPANASAIQWIDVTNEHFMVWMRTAATPNFRKLWGHIDSGLPAGQYTLKITNQFPVQQFSGTKTFVLSTTNVFGGKNSFLAISYIVVGSFALFVAIIFAIKKLLLPSNFEELKKLSQLTKRI